MVLPRWLLLWKAILIQSPMNWASIPWRSGCETPLKQVIPPFTGVKPLAVATPNVWKRLLGPYPGKRIEELKPLTEEWELLEEPLSAAPGLTTGMDPLPIS